MLCCLTQRRIEVWKNFPHGVVYVKDDGLSMNPPSQLRAEDQPAFARQLFWGVGNGWTAAGLMRVVRALPPAMRSERDLLAGFVREAPNRKLWRS
jgi:hypothetical protein